MRLEIPAGIYALRFAYGARPAAEVAAAQRPPLPPPAGRRGAFSRLRPLAIALALIAAFIEGWLLAGIEEEPANAIWRPLFASERPVLVVLGDYDYAYLARCRASGNVIVLVIGGARDTRLRSLSGVVAGADLPPELAEAAADSGAFEALFQITGQQGADLSERLLVARARPAEPSQGRTADR